MSKNVIIAMIEAGRMELERTARAVPEDKLNWKPLDNGRPVLELLTYLTRRLGAESIDAGYQTLTVKH